jgi:hypothetical protein
MKIINALEGSDGFETSLMLTKKELDIVRNLIRSQWLQRINEYQPSLTPLFESIEIDHYHEYSHLLPHESFWTKSKRIMSSDSVKIIRQTSIFKKLELSLGKFDISGEDSVEKEEIYWRLVRPNGANDVGPLHADEWFWVLGRVESPANHQRIKVWISIYSEPGKSGFKFVRGSHKKSWRYHGKLTGTTIKPQIDEDEASLGVEAFISKPGQAIVFHDKLLHGGMVGGTLTRVSLEFTLFLSNDRYFVNVR